MAKKLRVNWCELCDLFMFDLEDAVKRYVFQSISLFNVANEWQWA